MKNKYFICWRIYDYSELTFRERQKGEEPCRVLVDKVGPLTYWKAIQCIQKFKAWNEPAEYWLVPA